MEKRPLARRSRKTRYRQPRFDSRIRLKRKIESKIQTHIKTSLNVNRILQ
ncbi:MAG: RRXRR domain-containing protein [Clostridiales bacterium]|nr:RRXRR domain-containing protein [Clostridiales bacterium]